MAKTALPVWVVPTEQRWDCHHCGACCQNYEVSLSDADVAKIESQGWDPERDLHGLPAIAVGRGGRKSLTHRADGRCVFLADDRRCNIHRQHGSAAKPLACQIYPFILVPAGDRWWVSIRLGCPSALGNEGRPLGAHQADLEAYGARLEARTTVPVPTTETTAGEWPVPALAAGESLPGAEWRRLASILTSFLAEDHEPLELQLRHLLGWSRMLRRTRLTHLRGARLEEFLQLMQQASREDIPAAEQVPRPSHIGRMLFRPIVAIYARRDQGVNAGLATRGRWTRLQFGARFALGLGTVPRLHGQFGPVSFRTAAEPCGERLALPEAEALLRRFYRLKLSTLQFCGPTNFHRYVWDGLDSLLLTYPIVAWLSHAFAGREGVSPVTAVTKAVQQVDDAFGFNPLLNGPWQAWAIRTLSERDELARWIAWYGRRSAAGSGLHSTEPS